MNLKTFAAIGVGAMMCAGLRGSDRDLWKSLDTLIQLAAERIKLSDFREGVPLLSEATERDPTSVKAVAALADAYHLQRRLDEAAAQYSRLLQINPASVPTPQEEESIFRFAPRVFEVAADPFPIKDVVAIHHPTEPIIAYHFFWDDDIDFPEDNDPCDHELIWIRYDRNKQVLTDVVTYFHGRLLRSAEAIEDAHRHEERARINVQWGKHGSLPFGWERLSIQANTGDVEAPYLDLTKPMSLEQYNRATYLKLHNEGRRLIDHPLASAWPKRFDGSWDDFIAFDKEVDIRSLLRQRRMLSKSEWNNAVIQRQFLRYNFRPKTEWPDGGDAGSVLELRRALAPLSDNLTRAIDVFRTPLDDLPQASLFKPETPRYPNVWFYAPVSEFQTYTEFVEWLNTRFRAVGYSADAVSLNEGADIALSIEHLQPWNAVSRLSHAHALHIRFFWKRLRQSGLEQAKFGDRDEPHWRVAASVHYEVEHASPLHADVEVCSLCGRTGAYADKTGSLVEQVHDPLGLELLLWGTIRGEAVEFPDQSGTFPTVERFLNSRAGSWRVSGPSARADMNTGAVAIVPVAK